MSSVVSIVIPIHNSEEYLNQCLSSIMQQSFSDWECILVDDGSEDNSYNICERYSMLDERFRVIKQRNEGVSSARNRGLEEITGDLLCFIDSDDWIDCDYLEKIVGLSEKADLVVSGQIREFPNREPIYLIPQREGFFTIDKEHAEEFVQLEELLLLYAPHEKLYRSTIIKQFHLTFPSNCSYGEDLIFNYSYLDRIKTISYEHEARYHYRMSPNSLSRTFRINQFYEDYSQWKILKSFYDRHELWCDPAESYLYRRLWGIVYDGIFQASKFSESTHDYINSILNIPEISELRRHKQVFSCASWIKFAIIHKISPIFCLYFNYVRRSCTGI